MNAAVYLLRLTLLVLVLNWFLLQIKRAICFRLSYGEWPREKSWVWWINAITLAVCLTGCGSAINPVRYQVQEVLVTKPCLVGKTPPPEAQTRIAVTCDGKDCTLKCGDTRPEECAKHMAADIIELQREARESRSLIKECSK